jgi:hypothetical protein
MVRVDGSVRVRDEKGRDVFWKFENGMSYMGFVDAALSNELMRVMPGAVERLILDKDIIPKNLCGKKTATLCIRNPWTHGQGGIWPLAYWGLGKLIQDFVRYVSLISIQCYSRHMTRHYLCKRPPWWSLRQHLLKSPQGSTFTSPMGAYYNKPIVCIYFIRHYIIALRTSPA